MSGYLELPDGGFLGVKDGLVFGRISGCDVVVDDSKASRRHARLIVESGVVEIEDMDSSNGTLLNGKPVQRRMMRDGDEVRIGQTVIKYREGLLPGSQARSRSSAGARPVFDDDDDLFGDSSSQSSTPPAADPPAPAAAPPVVPPAAPERHDLPDGGDDLIGDDPPRASGSVVEFEDEVVEVQQSRAPTRSAPEPVVEVRKPRQDMPLGKAKPATAGADEVSGTSGRILQYSKRAGGKNPLGDDLGQMSQGMRLMVVLGVIAAGGGIAYGIMTAMQ